MKDNTKPPTSLERLAALAKRIVAVPKAELDARAAAYERRKRRKKRCHLCSTRRRNHRWRLVMLSCRPFSSSHLS